MNAFFLDFHMLTNVWVNVILAQLSLHRQLVYIRLLIVMYFQIIQV